MESVGIESEGGKGEGERGEKEREEGRIMWKESPGFGDLRVRLVVRRWQPRCLQ